MGYDIQKSARELAEELFKGANEAALETATKAILVYLKEAYAAGVDQS